MRQAHGDCSGLPLATPVAIDAATETHDMRVRTRLPEDNWLLRPAQETPMKDKILDCWKPSDRRRLGHLSFKAYEQASIICPTDMWSYQRLFIEQRRDGGNLWAKPKVGAEAPTG